MYLLLFLFGLVYQCLNGAIPSMKCSIKAPPKCKTSIYVLTEICLQWSKRLSPNTLNLKNGEIWFCIIFFCCVGDFFFLSWMMSWVGEDELKISVFSRIFYLCTLQMWFSSSILFQIPPACLHESHSLTQSQISYCIMHDSHFILFSSR